MTERARCSSDIIPCEIAIRNDERLDLAEAAIKNNSAWLLRLDSSYNALSLDVAKEIAILKTKLLFVSALGALTGSSVGAIVAGLVVFKIARG